MTRGLEAPVNPELLVWARETAGMSIDEAAKKISISPTKLKSVESGEDGQYLTFSQLKTAASAYKRPVAAFFLPVPPSERRMPLHDFRLHQDAMVGYSSRLTFEIRSVQAHRDDLIDLSSIMGEDVVKFEWRMKRDTSPKQAAALIRKIIGIDIGNQLKWRDSTGALKKWKEAVEKLGVLVFESSNIPLLEMRGLSIPAEQLPIIVLNGGDTHNGRIFTLFHEVVHLLLNQGGVCDLDIQENIGSPDAALEVYCNAVAAEFLVPEETLMSQLSGEGLVEWGDDKLREMAKTFSVSRDVILRRLLTLGRTTKGFYLQKHKQYRLEFERNKEALRKKENKSGPSPSVMTVRNLGRPFVRTVLQAYSQEKISLSSVSDYLGVKVRHLEKIGELVGSKFI